LTKSASTLALIKAEKPDMKKITSYNEINQKSRGEEESRVGERIGEDRRPMDGNGELIGHRRPRCGL